MTLIFWLTTVPICLIVLFGYNDSLVRAEMTANSSTAGKFMTTKIALTSVTHHSGNITVNETEILANWFQFKYRFALQCALVFFMFGCVIFLCFIPDEPMFDISYNKYDTNEITKYATTSNVKMAPGKAAKTRASVPTASSSTAKKRAPVSSTGRSKP